MLFIPGIAAWHIQCMFLIWFIIQKYIIGSQYVAVSITVKGYLTHYFKVSLLQCKYKRTE